MEEKDASHGGQLPRAPRASGRPLRSLPQLFVSVLTSRLLPAEGSFLSLLWPVFSCTHRPVSLVVAQPWNWRHWRQKEGVLRRRPHFAQPAASTTWRRYSPLGAGKRLPLIGGTDVTWADWLPGKPSVWARPPRGPQVNHCRGGVCFLLTN